MNVSLTPFFDEMIKEKVASGRYNNASEVVREALRLLHARDAWLDEERSAWNEAAADVAAGRVHEATDEYLDKLDKEVDDAIARERHSAAD